MMMFFQVCNDGKLLDGRSFCGVGNCNIFGCDCKDGCREAPNFQTCFAQCYCSVPERLKARGKYFCIRVCSLADKGKHDVTWVKSELP